MRHPALRQGSRLRLDTHIKRYFLLFATVPMFLASALCTLAISTYYEYANRQEVRYSVETMQQELSRQLESWEELLQACASTDSIIQQMESGRTLDEEGRGMINTLLAGRGKTVQLHLISANGRFRFSTGSIPNLYQMPTFNEWPFFDRLRERNFSVRATNLSSYNARSLALSIGAPVRSEARLLGYAVLDVELSEIQEILRPYRSVNISDILLISADNMVVCSLSGHQENGLVLTDQRILNLLEAYHSGEHPASAHVVSLTDQGQSGLTLVVVPDLTPFWNLLPAVIIGLLFLMLCVVISALLMGTALSRRVSGQLNRLPDASRFLRQGEPAGYIQRPGDFAEIVAIGQELNQLNQKNRELLLSNQEKEELLNAVELSLLKAQMRPHFIYNVLNDMKSMAKLGRSQQIVELIVCFSALLRSSLSAHEEFATLAEEIDLVQKYVQMQNIRGNRPVRMRVRVEEGLADTEIPRLMLQPLVENAMLHGLRGRDHPMLLLTAQSEADCLVLQVTDNGRGIREAARFERIDGEAAYHAGIGLKNIARRMKLYYGAQGRIIIRSKAKHYTSVRLCIPRKIAE